MRITYIVGTRPIFVKVAGDCPLREQLPKANHSLVHTGQR
jgi:UDP-N-acetylglucosamine 2-epimerase